MNTQRTKARALMAPYQAQPAKLTHHRYRGLHDTNSQGMGR